MLTNLHIQLPASKDYFRLKLILPYYCLLISITSTHLQHELSQLAPLLPHTSRHVLGYQDPGPGVLISIGVISKCADQYRSNVCWSLLEQCPSVLINIGAMSECADQYFNCNSPFKEVSLPEDSIAIIRVLKTKNQRRPAANLAPYKNVIAFLEISAKLDGFDHKTYHTSYHIIETWWVWAGWCWQGPSI